MDAVIFLVFGVAVVFVRLGRPRASLLALVAALILTAAWFKYHVTDPLKLGF